MTEKTDEQIAKEKASVDAMRNARANMATVLDRVASLEQALRNAAGALDEAAKYIPETAYGYKTEIRLRDEIKAQAEKARKAL